MFTYSWWESFQKQASTIPPPNKIIAIMDFLLGGGGGPPLAKCITTQRKTAFCLRLTFDAFI